MTQTSEFDPHAMIRWLAEQERECPGRSLLEIQHFLPCGFCEDTGRIVPFAALRVACTSGWHNYPKEGTNYPNCLLCENNRGWVAVQDVEKACWRSETVRIQHGQESVFLAPDGKWYLPEPTTWDEGYSTREEATLRAAEAWVKEHKA